MRHSVPSCVPVLEYLTDSSSFEPVSHSQSHDHHMMGLPLQANDAGDYFPLWGTCLGFQLLSVIQSNDSSLLIAVDAENYSIPLVLTPGRMSHPRYCKNARIVDVCIHTHTHTTRTHAHTHTHTHNVYRCQRQQTLLSLHT